ncbi:MAG: 4Fe-4S dicluster domain-containing protein [Myxococcales bacterium]|nr:4Fe-4S dicluster domain-containing protein [Myxococcales bacterium]MCB9641951.1 4Fe-4S dicluster domain-containing protein [Myxococcales bacterium]
MPYRLDASSLQTLFENLKARGYDLLGPQRKDQAIVYDTLESVEDLPQGWTDEQEAGHYKLKRRDDDAYFGYVVGPRSWKRVFLPPRKRLWTATQKDGQLSLEEEPLPSQPIALIGVRSCEIHAIAIQDRVLLEGPHPDPYYAAMRAQSFIVAVNCTQSAATCFCTSMDTGPGATFGFDLAMTEIMEPEHIFVLEAGSPKGRELLADMDLENATDLQQAHAKAGIEQARQQIKRELPQDGLKDLLYQSFEHTHWDDIASRCLSCANCTMVCPTCFCTEMEDVTDLTGDHAERWQRWDSCFHESFTHVHGGSVRQSTRSRYRQWLTHKLASWLDQFGTTGCVGCGRCITWCPAGIDLTAEVKAFRDSERK